METYFSDYTRVLQSFLEREENRVNLKQIISKLKEIKQKNKLYLIGNGGSASIAEHMAVDFSKNAGLQACTFSSSSTLTAYANDYGYDQVYAQCIKQFCSEGDFLFAISSSGESANILAACEEAKRKGMFLVTFSGFKEGNPLSKQGEINFWVPSFSYGYVELIHNLLIHYINDSMIGSAVYASEGFRLAGLEN